MNRMKKTVSPIWEIPREDFLSLLEENRGYGLNSVLRQLGYAGGGARYNTLIKRIKHEGLILENYKKRIFGSCISPTDEDAFTENSSLSRNSIKSRIIKNKLIPYECEKCSNIGQWQGEDIVLQLEHKNGVNNDNRLENLTFLCPNCHSQTSTWSGKKIVKCKTIHICNTPKCTKPVSTGGVLCRDCFQIKERKIKDRPSLEQLLKDVEELNFVNTGKKYGVSDNAIRKWIKYYRR